MLISPAGKALKRAGNSLPPGSTARGFSLIELMVVLVIMAIVLGVAGPRVAKEMGVLHLRTTAKQVAAALRWTRSQALSTGKIYNAVFDCTKQRVIISDYAGSVNQPLASPLGAHKSTSDQEQQTSADQVPQEQRLKIYELPENIFFSRIEIADVLDINPDEESIYQMTFFPDGTSMGGEVVISDDKTRSFIISVDFLTGIVSLEEPDET